MIFLPGLDLNVAPVHSNVVVSKLPSEVTYQAAQFKDNFGWAIIVGPASDTHIPGMNKEN